MKKMIYWTLGTFLFLCLILLTLSIFSRKPSDAGLSEGRLRPCPGTPNCVCSEHRGTPSFVEPLAFDGPPAAAWQRAKGVIEAMGGRIEVEEESYLRATFSTRIFRFQDDLELRLAPEEGCIHIRSSSRVGYSDLGMNRKRVESIRLRYMGKAQAHRG